MGWYITIGALCLEQPMMTPLCSDTALGGLDEYQKPQCLALENPVSYEIAGRVSPPAVDNRKGRATML